MPELPEVENAAALIRSLATGKRIAKVETTEDDLVFHKTSASIFAQEITGRTIQTAERYGKVFYIQLDGDGKVPVLHFGMTGKLQVKGEKALDYQSNGGKGDNLWPPRFMKFILHISSTISSEPIIELAFSDPRRLGRIRLCASPLTESPISELGFDPIFSMPSLEDFANMVSKRSCPVKALLLDQSFSAGVGNWVADEVLYHARIHPAQRCDTLDEVQKASLHHQVQEVCQIAISVNADASKFPENWLMKHRWGKGKKANGTLKLPNGQPATIVWVTVGGRTSAYVSELQKLPKKRSDLVARITTKSETHANELNPRSSKRKKGTTKSSQRTRRRIPAAQTTSDK